MLNPITVRKTPVGYHLIAGLHRLAAATLLGWPTIHANVRTLDNLTADTIRLAENVQRTNLSPIEEATQLANLVNTNPQAVDGVARDIGRPTSWVLDRLALLEYPESLLKHIHSKTVSLAAAKHLARIQPKDLRDTRIEQAAHYKIDAKTASLWLQQSVATAPLEIETSEKPCQQDFRQPQTETTVLCFVCRNRVNSTLTIPAHVCTTCLEQIQSSHNADSGH